MTSDPSWARGLPRGIKPNIEISFLYSRIRWNDYMVHSGCVTKTIKTRFTKMTYTLAKGVAGHGLCTSTNNLSAVTQGSIESCTKSASASAADGMDDRVAVHPLTARLFRKQEQYAIVDAYISCCLNIRLNNTWATPVTIAGRMRRREAWRGRAAPDKAGSPTRNQGRCGKTRLRLPMGRK
jgi:hypothetical protein